MKRPKALWDIFAVLLSLIFCYSYISYGIEALFLVPMIFLLLKKSGEFLVFRAAQPMLILPLVFVEGNLLFGIAVLVIGALSSSAVSLLRNLGKRKSGDFVNLNFALISACLLSGFFDGTVLRIFEAACIAGYVSAPLILLKLNQK